MNPWEHVKPAEAASPEANDSGPVRYERGSRVYGSDGPIGTLRQVVVDDERGEVTLLVVQPADGSDPALAPVDLVEGSAGQAIFLRVTQQQFALGASRSPRYERRHFAAANLKRLAGIAAGALRPDRLRGISRVERYAVVTGPIVEENGTPVAPRQARVARLERRVAASAPMPVVTASSSAD